MANHKEKKSFKKFAKKHLAGVIETRRKTAKSTKEKLERIERRKAREAREAAREEKEHAEHLERLKDTDPNFFSYLEEEDPTLLQFGREDIEVVDEDAGSDDETDVDEPEGEGAEDNTREADGEQLSKGRITREELEKLVAGNKMEPCVDIFASAVRELGYPLKENRKANSSRKFEDPVFVKESMLIVAQFVGRQLSTLISGKGAFKLFKTRYLVKRLLICLAAVIGESNVDNGLTAGLLHALVPFVPLLHYFKGVTKLVLKAALTLCTASEESVRVAAYVVLRSVATRATGTRSMYQSTAFKGIFLVLIRAAHQYNVHCAPIIAFLSNCVVDLYGTDMEAAYQHTFVYLRQLAIYLRAALQQQSQSNVRAVVNWQYLIALRTWGLVVSTYAEPAQLGPLIHPVVQLATGLMDLFSSPRMFPMHLQIIEVLNHISRRADGLYIPVAPYLMRILTSPSVALAGATITSTNKDSVSLAYTIRVKKSLARSSTYQREVWMEALYLLTEHLATHSHTVGFPETFWAVDSTLKKLRSEVKVPSIHSQISNLLRHIQSASSRIIAKRDQANFGPADLTAVKQFEDELKSAGSSLATYYRGLLQHRVERFGQEHAQTNESRPTLDAVVQKRLSKVMKRPRATA